ncbi:hypothetical protein RDI58_013306 [Solanum bulbocastanum]|uniref:Uncharacterized protein n=1 Tax=Solanum bulbocastanum TaxID=147425 RepID=A0AAN8YF39_SOLBU
MDEVAEGFPIECWKDDEFVEDEYIVFDSLNDESSNQKKELEQYYASFFLLKSNKPAHPLLKIGDEDMEDNDDGADNDEGSGDNDE